MAAARPLPANDRPEPPPQVFELARALARMMAAEDARASDLSERANAPAGLPDSLAASHGPRR